MDEEASLHFMSDRSLVDGRYEVHVGTAGAYCLTVHVPRAPNLVISSSGWSQWDGTCKTVKIGGEPLVIDVKLPKFYTVAGTVVDKKGEPFPDVSVGWDRGDFTIGHGTTDASGHFSLLALPGTTYVGFYVGLKRQFRLEVTVKTKNIANLKVALPISR